MDSKLSIDDQKKLLIARKMKIDKQIALLNEKNRKKDTRKKIVIGGAVLAIFKAQKILSLETLASELSNSKGDNDTIIAELNEILKPVPASSPVENLQTPPQQPAYFISEVQNGN